MFCLYDVSLSYSLHKTYQRYSGNLKYEPLVHSDGYFAWTDCVRSSAGKVSYLDIFSSSNLQNIDIFLPFTASIR